MLSLALVFCLHSQAVESKSYLNESSRSEDVFIEFHQEILVKFCQRCHSNSSSWLFYVSDPESTARQLIERSYVKPLEPNSGTLYNRISGKSWFVRSMPPGGFSRNDSEDEEIRAYAVRLLNDWISTGAQVPFPNNDVEVSW